ncbi:MAG: glycerol-3-phosphate dehydrogenase/oxidase [Planctomycetes bacterium]|nr:glycerol-3-phosphate dehydrogenase/oxidase [Planctomycetota bacterium]
MRTDPRVLHGTTQDLLVVGAGIQGAAIARDAAERGLRVALIEARDIAAGTSSRSSRLVHGGLRYLRQGHLALVREALRERERLLRTVPHLVRPVPMLMPFHRESTVSPAVMRFGTWLYAALARGSTLPRPRTLGADAAAAAFPGLRRTGLRSAIEFFDAATQDARLTLANVRAAVAAGAALVTHCEVVGGGGDGLHVVDRFTGAEFAVRARHVVNATGPRADGLRALLHAGGEPLVRPSRGSHLVLPPRPGETALAAFLPDGRIQFVVAHRDGTLCGTTDVDDPLTADEGPPPAEDVHYLLGALAFLLDPPPTTADVRFAYAGWRSLPARPGPAGALNREAFVVDEDIAMGRLHTVVGGKLTTHRSLAERVVGAIFARREPSPTRRRALPGGGGPREVTDPLWWRHGGCAGEVRAIAGEEAAWREPLCPHRPFLAAELVYALRREGAATFADALLRRLVHSQGPCLDEACLRTAHALFRRERQWPVDDEPGPAIAAVRGEVRALAGDLAPPGAAALTS